MIADRLPAARANRFTGLPRSFAAILLLLLAASLLTGLVSGGQVATAVDASARVQDGLVGDHALYADVLHRVEAGESYYAAVAAEHRAHHYPLRPFFAVRLPTLMHLVAAIGLPATQLLSLLVGLAAICAWRVRLRSELDSRLAADLAALLVAVNLWQLVERDWILIHEVVAGALIALALALHRPRRPWAAMIVLSAALSIRETVLPVAMLFGLFALCDRDWRAVAGWLAVGLMFVAGLGMHLSAVAAATTAADAASPGWMGMGGWATYVAFLRETSILRFAPAWVAATLVPLALLGWAGWKSRLGLAGFGVHSTYALLLMVAARPDNFYWGMLIAPSLFIGLVFAPAALLALVRSLLHPGVSVSSAAV